MKTNTINLLTACLLLLCSNILNAQWTLVWQDEFAESISGYWTYDIGMGDWGWGNNEQQFYRSENASIVNGMLQIQARKESYGGASYTSARLKTQGLKSFQYGKIEARISMPAFLGVWPAFWMLGSNYTSVGWPACGEIDIMEHVNTEYTVYGTTHWDYNGYASYGGNTSVDVTAFHVYSIEWDEEYIRWYVDGTQYHKIYISGGINGTEELHNDFFIILNMAIGGEWPGYSIDNSAFPANMLIDYVRVYEKSDDSDATELYAIEAEDYSDMSGVKNEDCSEGGQNVGYIDTGDWLAYNSITFPSSETYTFEYRVASLYGGQLSLDLNAGSIVLGTADIPATGDWQSWTTVAQSVYVNAGTYNLGIYASTGGWNINWIKIYQGTLKSSQPSNIHIPNTSPEIQIYPIPATNQLNISGLTGENTLEIIDLQGKTILTKNCINDISTLNISNLNEGVYFIKISNKVQTEIFKFIK